MNGVTDKDALEYLVSLGKSSAEPIEREYDGRKYINKQLNPMQPPTVTALGISTLKSLVELCSGKFSSHTSPQGSTYSFEGFDPTEHVIHVASPTHVQVIAAASNDWKQREVLINCVTPDVVGLKFGAFYKQDDFIIAMLSAFAPSADRDPLVKLAGNATAEQATTLVDDGVTQIIATRAGSTMKETTFVKGLVNLAPWRTFREVAQPESQFLFRVKTVDAVPQFALFEADGGAWKLAALDNVARYIAAALDKAVVVS